MRHTSKRLRIIVLLALTITLIMSSAVMVSPASAATGTKSMTVYDQVIKDGKYAYCATRKGIYKVNVKTGWKKRIARPKYSDYSAGLGAMRLYEGYIYYVEYVGGYAYPLYRVSVNGRNKKKLGNIYRYAIRKDRIYVQSPKNYYAYKTKTLNLMMDLKGRHQMNSNYEVKNKIRRTNKKGYKIKTVVNKVADTCDDEGFYVTVTYASQLLITPSGKVIKLCNFTM